MAWLDALAAALVEPRMDEVEALRGSLPPAETLEATPEALGPLIERLAALTGRPAGPATAERLAWWLDALLLQRVIRVPPPRGRHLVPALLILAAVLLGLLVGRIAAAGVVSLGLVLWALRAGGSRRERRGPWLRLGQLIFDLRQARWARVDDDWFELEGHRVPAAALAELGIAPPAPSTPD